MDEHFHAVIVGSGFGGSVVAYRLAEAGMRVCVLERGQAYPPNSFPRAPYKVKRNFWDPSAGLYGMFNVWSFRNSGALVSAGLGGGSLIYANVLIRKDERWFVKEDLGQGGYEHWPVTRADLDPHYDRVETMMNVQKYPFDLPPYDATPKTRAMQHAAAQLGLRWQLPNLAVTFANPGEKPVPGEPIREAPGHENLHGRTRYTCRLCGECDIGCNYGSKNTLDYNYLSEAERLGAELRTLCEVRSFEPRPGGGFAVSYVRHDPAREGARFDTSQLPQTLITGDRLILAAGALGSPYLLLKNRSAFPRISQALGSRYSVNGDLLSFIMRSREQKDGRWVQRVLDPSFGPVITSAIRVGDALDGDGSQGRGFYVEDGGYPEFFNWLLEIGTGIGPSLERLLRFGLRSLWGYLGLNPDADLGAEVSELFGPCTVSKSSIPILSMGRDLPTGTMRLRGRYLEVDWTVGPSQSYYDRVVETGRRIAEALRADYVENLPYKYLHQVLTAHPLGGCPMGRHKGEGVVDASGEVFDYPGLCIADGSVLPGPVGPNPSLTIAALADRFADAAIARHKGARP